MSERPQTLINSIKHAAEVCREIFEKKMHDYSTAWRILRTESVTDQIFIKARRIRSIQTKGVALVNEDIRPEFIGIVNYAAMGLIQLELGPSDDPKCLMKMSKLYTAQVTKAKSLMDNKTMIARCGSEKHAYQFPYRPYSYEAIPHQTDRRQQG